MRYTKNLQLAKPSPDDFYDIAEFGNNMDILDEFYGTTFQESNRNLLDNAWFTINSRGQNSYAANEASVYSFDRWKLLRGSATKNNDGSITLTPNTSGEYQQIYTTLKNFSDFVGKTVTLSAIINENIYSVTKPISEAISEAVDYTTEVETNIRLYIYKPAKSNTFNVGVSTYYGETITIKAVKLELGEISTLDKDNPPDDRLEYIKCITSKADPNDAYANKPINFASNRNLLDNWYFADPINQRGSAMQCFSVKGTMMYSDEACTVEFGKQTKAIIICTKATTNYKLNGFSYYVKASDVKRGYVNAGYAIDRWKQNYLITTLTDKGLSLAFDNSTTARNNGYIYCPLPKEMNLGGKTLTLSALYDDGKLATLTGKMPTVNNAEVNTSWIDDKFQLELGCFTNRDQAALIVKDVSTEFEAVKLELGTIQTLAHLENGKWVLNDPPPNKAEELAKCQWYNYRTYMQQYQWFGLGVGVSDTRVDFEIVLPRSMRIRPTLSYSGDFMVAGGGLYPITDLTLKNYRDNIVFISATVASRITVGQTYKLALTDDCLNGYLNFSADL